MAKINTKGNEEKGWLSRKEIYTGTIGTDEYVDWVLQHSNLPKSIKLDRIPENPQTMRDINEYERTMAGVRSGRYMRELNRNFIKKYIAGLDEFYFPEIFKDLQDRLKALPIRSMAYIAQMLPDMNDWYKATKRGFRIDKDTKVKKFVDIDDEAINVAVGIEQALLFLES